MRRAITWVLAIVLLAALAVGGLFAVTFMGLKPVADGAEVNRARIVADGFVTAGVIDIGDGRAALVDAGNDPSGAALLSELSRRGLGPQAVAAIFVTHGHSDHVAAVTLFPGAQVMALAAEVPLVEGRAKSRGPLPRLFPAGPTGITVHRALMDGERVEVGAVGVRVFAVPGHTVGSAAYLVDDVLFLGDSANADSDGNLEGAPWIFSDSQAENRASLARLGRRLAREGVSVRAIVPSHSGMLADGLAPLTRFAEGQP
jgi:glyoxylase-like metal-dependent hydrolase (beta-lactamase superfamily II)